MQNNILKIIFILTIFIMTCFFPKIVYAGEGWIDDAKSFLDSSRDDIKVDEGKLKDASNSVYNLLSSVGMILSVIIGIILGIKFMIVSAEDKAKVKEGLIPYITGCVVIFGAFGIWKLLINTFSGI